VDPVPVALPLRNSGSAGNRTRASGSVARNSDTRPQRRSQNDAKVQYYSEHTLLRCKGKAVPVIGLEGLYGCGI
jgi:hypothetical protein